jgi:hypothetical protein
MSIRLSLDSLDYFDYFDKFMTLTDLIVSYYSEILAVDRIWLVRGR